ncbi:TDT family transporter [Rhodovulum strictum]|uniref:Tellurium resistance protein n=1 Tax=Rhodovulum strictum TaxID=58314 RepID=A0A844BFR6_9RHOB|nr:tellurium resistance protein [Rhodovulum strictum]MRH20215.1 tellurium resistance protein [Rhodovulum strictum]
MSRPLAPRPRFGDQTPPAIFPPVLGALALGLAWRQSADILAAPPAVGELILGAVTLLYLFCVASYALKVVRRPGVLPEDLRVLPGRAGLSAMVLSAYLVSAALVPLAPGAALGVLGAALALHAGLVALVLAALIRGPAEQRRVTPVWHLQFVGFILAALPAQALGFAPLASVLLHVTGAAALAIWGASLVQFLREDVPAPLRPLLAIHLAPACLLGSVALALDNPGLGWAATLFAGLLGAGLLIRLPWLIKAGFSPLWGAFTFPLAALANLLLGLAPGQGTAIGIAGGIVLVAATLAIPPILVAILRAWARGGLGARTNAARV